MPDTLIEMTTLPMGFDVDDDCRSLRQHGRNLQYLVPEMAMRDALREATGQDWYLEHTGGGCTCLTLQGEDGMWAIFEDFSAPRGLDESMILTYNKGQIRHSEYDDHEEWITVLADESPFRDVIALCVRLGNGEAV